MGWYSPFSSGHTTWRPAVLRAQTREEDTTKTREEGKEEEEEEMRVCTKKEKSQKKIIIPRVADGMGKKKTRTKCFRFARQCQSHECGQLYR
jgi:hypothetical protein